MSLASVIKQKEKSTKTSDKTPQFYNAEKNAFIAEMVGHENADVRLAAVSNEHTPAKVLQAQLDVEQDQDVIRAILMNENLPKKALLAFATKDPRAKMFDDDEQLIEYVDCLGLEQ
jgi:hypothetical protein